MPEAAEDISKQKDVREALAQTQGKKVVRAQAKDKFWFVTHALPWEAGRVKTHLIKKPLPALNAAPDKVLFPKGPNR